jgi:chromosome segregation ATPase
MGGEGAVYGTFAQPFVRNFSYSEECCSGCGSYQCHRCCKQQWLTGVLASADKERELLQCQIAQLTAGTALGDAVKHAKQAAAEDYAVRIHDLQDRDADVQVRIHDLQEDEAKLEEHEEQARLEHEADVQKLRDLQVSHQRATSRVAALLETISKLEQHNASLETEKIALRLDVNTVGRQLNIAVAAFLMAAIAFIVLLFKRT